MAARSGIDVTFRPRRHFIAVASRGLEASPTGRVNCGKKSTRTLVLGPLPRYPIVSRGTPGIPSLCEGLSVPATRPGDQSVVNLRRFPGFLGQPRALSGYLANRT